MNSLSENHRDFYTVGEIQRLFFNKYGKQFTGKEILKLFDFDVWIDIHYKRKIQGVKINNSILKNGYVEYEHHSIRIDFNDEDYNAVILAIESLESKQNIEFKSNTNPDDYINLTRDFKDEYSENDVILFEEVKGFYNLSSILFDDFNLSLSDDNYLSLPNTVEIYSNAFFKSPVKETVTFNPFFVLLKFKGGLNEIAIDELLINAEAVSDYLATNAPQTRAEPQTSKTEATTKGRPEHRYKAEIMRLILGINAQYPTASKAKICDVILAHFSARISRNTLEKWIKESEKHGARYPKKGAHNPKIQIELTALYTLQP